MIPAETLHDALSRWTTTDGPATLTHALGDWSVALQAERADTIGCKLESISFTRTAVEPSTQPVRAWADRIAAQAQGLLEPLRVIETDATENIAVLRSDSPSTKGSKKGYYELTLDGRGSANFQRFEFEPGGKRAETTFVLTHEVIGTLANAVCVR